MTWPSDRRTFVSLGLQCVVNAFVYSTYVARLPDIRDGAGLTISQMGVVMTIGNLAGFAAMLPSAPVIRRWGSKRVMVVASVAYVLHPARPRILVGQRHAGPAVGAARLPNPHPSAPHVHREQT